MLRTDLIAPLATLLARHAVERPSAIAFEDHTRQLTYAALADSTARIAVWLAETGVQPGDRVAIHQPNSVDWVELVLAVNRAGGVAVPISFSAPPDEIAYRLEDANCVLAFTHAEKADALRALCAAHGIAAKVASFGDGRGEAASAGSLTALPRDPPDILQPAFIVYTSGTTGRAKGVVLSVHSLLWVTASCWAPIVGMNKDDVVLNALPLFHSYALSFAVVTIVAVGAREYIMDGFSNSQMVQLLSERAFTVLPGVPTVFHYLLDKAKNEGRRSLGSIRLCLSAGAIMPGPLNQDFEAWFGVKLLDGYGITETSTMVTMNWPTGGRKMGSCGIPLPGLAVRVVDLEGRDVVAGMEGELIVRGPNVMLGYHGNPKATASALQDGWYRTGDLANFDRDGFITITGRLKEMIIRGGQNISPAEVEQAVVAFPSVLDCAVVGVKHQFLGEVPAAFIIPRPDQEIDVEALAAHCRNKLSTYKVPQHFYVVDAIPRTGSGKVQRFKLQAPAEPGLNDAGGAGG
jgi:long-chain acyl-CoA synthetase